MALRVLRGAKMVMHAVTVHDLNRNGEITVLAFDLSDILHLDEPGVVGSVWRCKWVDCVGKQADALHAASDGTAAIPGGELLRLASGVDQVMDGDFAAFRPGDRQPWLVVRAIDSTLYVVASAEEGWLGRVRERFEDVRDAPEEVDDLDPWWLG